MDLDTLLARFDSEYLEPNSITLERRRQQRVFLRRLDASFEHPLSDVCAADVNAFIGAELKRGIHPNTGRKCIGMLHSFARWGGDNGLLPNSAELQLIRSPRGSSAQNTPQPYKVTEIRALRDAVAARYPVLPVQGRGSRAIECFVSGRQLGVRRHLWRHAKRLQLDAQIALALELGLRRIEMHELTVAAVHYDNVHVVVRTAKQGPGSRKTRAIPYTAHARKVMAEWLDFRYLLSPKHQSPWLLLPMVGLAVDQVKPQSLQSLAKTLPDGFRWHRLRHTAATEWLRAGVPVEKVRIYMGHSDIEQTLAYTEILDSDIESEFSAAEAAFAKRLGWAAA